MQLAVAYPWWAMLLLAAIAVIGGWAAYAGTTILSRNRRLALASLRTAALLVLVACVLNPVRVVPVPPQSDTVVPVLIDASRSMRLPDASGRPRLDAALDVWRNHVRPVLGARVRPELLSFGAGLVPADEGELLADAPRTDLAAALRDLRQRYRLDPPKAVVVISDGGDTSDDDTAAVARELGVPVYAVGVGATTVSPDFEVVDVSVGDRTLVDSAVDLSVVAVGRGSTAPFDLRLLENGRPVDLRRVVPNGDGSPVRTTFTVSAPGGRPAVYTVEIPSATGELVSENNRRSVVVEPPGRRRRVLMIEGAPGFEHSFLKRALAADPGLEIDSVVRKGRDDRGAATYFVQAGDRASRLGTGFPQDLEALFEYDAVLLANVEPDALSRAQLQMIADFVDRRGGGVLVFGARSFAQQGFASTPVEDVLPLRLVGRGDGIIRVSASDRPSGTAAVSLTADGRMHPVMRLAGADDPAARWRSVPALPGVAALGSLRPGAQALALVNAPDGFRPLVAVQRYGQGRAMVFAGEGSWRWRMQLPSTDRTHELFWRQAVRWVSSAAPDPVNVTPVAMPADAAGRLSMDVRNAEFLPVADADVEVGIAAPGGHVATVTAQPVDRGAGAYAAEWHVGEPGLYKVTVRAVRQGATIGTSERWLLAGGADVEMADPRLNDDVLRRLAAATGGRYLDVSNLDALDAVLEDAVAAPATPVVQSLWHNGWVFVVLMLLLAAEWTLRRRWGLR